jgi:hypothetical protein
LSVGGQRRQDDRRADCHYQKGKDWIDPPPHRLHFSPRGSRRLATSSSGLGLVREAHGRPSAALLLRKEGLSVLTITSMHWPRPYGDDLIQVGPRRALKVDGSQVLDQFLDDTRPPFSRDPYRECDSKDT